MKKRVGKTINLSTDELIEQVVGCNTRMNKKLIKCALMLLIITPLVCLSFSFKNTLLTDGDVVITVASAPLAATSAKKDLIAIPSGTIKANPFLPYRDLGSAANTDVPSYELLEPPETIQESSDAARVMDTIVSGILFDKFSPSAILNIEGNDYLVKKGDVVNNYKVLNIAQDSVTVKLGNNTYKAGIGEILTEGTINHNDVSNLNNKFGGERQ